MNVDLKKYEEERLAIKKFSLIMTIVMIVIAVIGFVFIFIIPVPFVFIFCILIDIVLLGVSSTKKRSFLREIKGKVVENLVKQELGEDAIYQENSGLDLNTLINLGLYKYPDRFHFEDYIKAKYNGISYEMCDANFEERHVYVDSKGNEQVTYETFFRGRVIRIDFKKQINFKMKIIQGYPNGLYTNGYSKVETEVIQFNKKFNLYSTNKEQVFYYVTPTFIQKVLELESLFKGTLQMVMDGDFLYIFINDSTDSLEFSLKRPIDDRALDIIRSQLSIGSAIINELKLDTSKFNENIKI